MFAKIKTLLLDTRILLACILLLGFVFRIWGLGSAEIFHDEGIYAFRSIGYMDFIQNADQTTPVQWFKDLPQTPWWTKLSFHDAPPLYFAVQHLFFKLFGDSIFVARLPSIVAGMFAIWLIFLIGRRLFSGEIPKLRYEQNIAERDWREHSNPPAGGYARSASNVSFGISTSDFAGLLAALFLSINHIHIWISRTSIIESLLLTLMLANIYFFLRFVEDKKWWFLFGLTFGFTVLTKYNAIVLVPVYTVYLLMYHRAYFRIKELYFAIGTTTILFSPVLIYNYYLYTTIHHFDLQFAYLFGQKTPEWRASLGKSLDPFSAYVSNILAMYSKPLLFTNGAGLIAILLFWRKNPERSRKPHLFLVSGILFTTLLLIKIGTAYRFLSLYLPFFVLLVVALVLLIKQHVRLKKLLLPIIIAVFCVWEIWFAIGGIFLEFPRLGVVELDNYLSEEIGSSRSSELTKFSNPHLDAIAQYYYSRLPKSDMPIMIVYDENIIISPRLWLFARRSYYKGIPSITVGQFNNILKQNGPEYFKRYRVYFVKANENSVMINTHSFYSPDAKNLEQFLRKEFNLNPTKITYGFQPTLQGLQQIPMFYVYKILF